MEDRDAKETELVRRREEELSKISSGIGKVFLHTIRQTERIKNAKLQNIDPRWERGICFRFFRERWKLVLSSEICNTS